MKVFSTFTGIGGFELGIIAAYETLRNADRGANRGGKETTTRAQGKGLVSEARENARATKRPAGASPDNSSYERPLFVGYSEIDPYAIKTYQRHFPDHKNYGDITKIDAHLLPDFDIIVGGFPCQAFSIAGKRGGFSDTRGTMFFELARIIKEKQPRLCLFENVKGLLSHDGGGTFRTIIDTLDELGYDCQWQVLNSKNHGVPQNRERIFIAGHLRGTPRPEIFPIGASDKEYIRKANEQGCASTLTGRNASGHNRRGNYIIHNVYGGFGEGIREFHDYSPTIRTAAGGGHIPNVVHIKEATKKGYAEATVGDSINLAVPHSATPRGRVGHGVAQTLDTSMQQHTLTSDMRIRRLTPVECERLQGFPDDWTAGESDTQRYKMCGNAVTTNVVRDIFIRLMA